MSFYQWVGEKIKKMSVWDIAILKLCVAAFVLMIAKLWPPILNPEWYVYGVIFTVTYIYLIYKIYLRN